MPQENIQSLLTQIEQMVYAASADQHIKSKDLRSVLRFISKMSQVLDQAFRNIYPHLIEVKYLELDEIHTDISKQLLKDLELIQSKEYFRDVELICGQLHELAVHYHTQIEPIVDKMGTEKQQSFEQIFMLLEHHEGYILQIFRHIIDELVYLIQSVADADSFNTLNKRSNERALEIKTALMQLQQLSNNILGLSGKTGFLELTNDHREEIQKQLNVHINYTDQSVQLGDISSSNSNIAIGSNNTQELRISHTEGADLKDIIQLLDSLKTDVRSENLTPKQEDKILTQLELTEDELKEKEPDKNYIAKKIQSISETMQQAGSLIDESTKIGAKLIKIAKWAGVALSLV